MQSALIKITIVISLSLLYYQPSKAQCHIDDWTALKALYESTNGDNWTDRNGWDIQIANQSSPPTDCDLSALYGVTLDVDTRISCIDLDGLASCASGSRINGNNLTGVLPPELGNLSNLVYIDLSNNRLSGNIPPELGNLSNLEGLELNSNQLNGSIPTELGNLSNLEVLKLSYNELNGSIPTELGNLSNLEVLELSYNELNGSIPTELGNLINLTHLNLFNNKFLVGSIPLELGNLINLTDLNIGSNQLTGGIPPELGNLVNLVRLTLGGTTFAGQDIRGNNLTGNIPPELGNLVNLEMLALNENQLSGNLPSELSNLNNLETLWISNNQLNGDIPTELGNLINLRGIFINNNEFSGTIPPQLGGLTNLTQLKLQNNQFVGNIPQELVNLTILNNFDVSNNNLSGCYSDGLNVWCGQFGNDDISDGNNFDVSFEDFCTTGSCINQCHIDDWTALKALYESTNGDSWSISIGWNTMIANQSGPPIGCDLSDLYGIGLNNEGRVDSIQLTNYLSGYLPPEIGSLSSLRTLKIVDSNVSGRIPKELGNISSLKNIELWGNNLSGTIPSELGNLVNLEDLELFENNLSGEIPLEIVSVSSLKKIRLWENDLSGNIPAELGSLANLENLELYRNNLSGEIPPELGNIGSLKRLHLWNNNLNGNIPPELGNLTNLESLRLALNNLTGNIPPELVNLSNLEILSLSQNNFTGEIPAELGDITSLEAIIIDNNRFTGNIPSNLSNKQIVSISNNYFTCSEIENFLNMSQVFLFTYEPQLYNYGEISLNTTESINNNTTFQLSAPFDSDDPNNLSFQWYQNDELIPGATDSILNVMVNEPSDAGLYSLQVTETCVSGIDFFSDPVIVAVDGFDHRSEPIEKKQVIVQYDDAEGRLGLEDSIFAHYNYELAVVDSCNCNRELYLYEFEDTKDQFDFVLQLNRVGKAIVLRDSADIDGGGFNYKIDLGIISNSANSYKVSTNCEGACEDTLEVVVLDTGYRGTDSVFLREPAIPYCENALSEDYTDAGWHGTYGFNMITKDFATGDKLKVMPLKIFDEEQATLFNLICGIYHAIDNGSDVINISAGYYGTKPFEIFEDVIEEAKAKGIFIVTSAGNDSVDINEKKQYPAYFSTEHDNVISVGSIDAQANYSSFSNYGNEAVTIAAYGEDILSKAEGALRQATGTSVATFIVSKELAHEIGLDKSRSFDAVWADFEANRLIYKSDLSTKTKTGKYLGVAIEQVFADDSICINLNPGWNLISFDVSPLDKSVANVFSDLQADNLDIVIGFDGGTIRYNPKGPPFLNTLKRLENGCGYWVKVQNADTLKVHGFSIEETFRKPLEVGWNLINFPQDSVQTPAAYFADLINNGNLEMVIGFDDGTVRYNPNGPPFLNTLHQLESGFGYWVKVTNSVNLKAK